MDTELQLHMSKKIAQLTKVWLLAHAIHCTQAALLPPQLLRLCTDATRTPTQRTQVIYHLNKKNEDLQFDVHDLVAQHAQALEGTSRDADEQRAAAAASLQEQQQAAAAHLQLAVQASRGPHTLCRMLPAACGRLSSHVRVWWLHALRFRRSCEPSMTRRCSACRARWSRRGGRLLSKPQHCRQASAGSWSLRAS
jgi:hypothetical protein